ncbi:pilus assembly PilX family protein [Thiolapillus sp.]
MRHQTARHHYQTATSKQRGVALVISLIVLLTVTLLSLTAMRSANLDTKISVNHQHKQLAFQAAENGLTKLTTLPADDMKTLQVPGNEGDSNSIPDPNDPSVNWYESGTSTDGPTTSATAELTLNEISPPGKYKFSGFGLNIKTIIFQADSYGTVEGTNAHAHNRMEVALIRE